MKVLGVIGTTALFLLVGATVPAFAQEEHQEEGAKPVPHEEPAKPAAKPEQAKPQKQEEQAKPVKQEEAKPQKQEVQPKPAKQEAAKPAEAGTATAGEDSADRREKSASTRGQSATAKITGPVCTERPERQRRTRI